MTTHIDTSTQAGFEALVKLVAAPIFQEKRRGVRKSHMQYVKEFTDGNRIEFVRFVTKRFLQQREKGKPISGAYISAICQTMQSYFKVKNFDKNDVIKTINKLKKVFNPENTDPYFYSDDTGPKFTVDREVIRPCVVETEAFYNEDEYSTIANYFMENLKNFLNSEKRAPDKMDELALLLCFLIAGPYRVNEVLKLSIRKAYDLVIRSSTRIKSKSGTDVVDMIIPVQFSSFLERYLEKCGYDNMKGNLFQGTYDNYYKLYKKWYIAVFKKPSKRRLFHGLRNYFSMLSADAGSVDVTKDAMNHASKRMTEQYIKNQRSIDTKKNVQDHMYRMYEKYVPTVLTEP